MSYEYYSQRYNITEAEYNEIENISNQMNSMGNYGDHIPFLLSMTNRQIKRVDTFGVLTITDRMRKNLKGD